MMRGSEEDKEKEKKTRQGPFVMQPGMCVCEVQCVCAPAYRCKDGYAIMCVLRCVCAHQCAHVNTCAYLCGRTGRAREAPFAQL